jgi:pimeloyl-ACP methyl ester carboxylesterase
MDTVISRDGTPIAYERTGTGPPLLLVHGTAGAGDRWAPILPKLSAEFSVLAMDRRGRGGSGDARCWSIEREFEDSAAVIDSLDEPVNVLGHSLGGTCALEASLLTDNIHKLILYEPDATPPDVEIELGDLTERLTALLAASDRVGVLTTFMRELVGMTDAEIEQYKSMPAWPTRVAAAHTLPRELRAAETYRFHAECFTEMSVPTLLLTGGDSPPLFSDGVKVLDRVLPNSHIVVMPGQQHIADVTAPNLFVREVLNFLRD